MSRAIHRVTVRRAWLLPLVALTACTHRADRVVDVAAAPTADWRTIATPADRARLRTWRETWTAALARVSAAGGAGQVAAERGLLSPDDAIGLPAPPPGDYRCRVTKLGAKQAGAPELVAYPPFACRVTQEEDVLSFAKLTGSQRPVGLLFPDDGARLIFLGTMMLGDERMAQQYGRDPERDMVGFVERIGEARWRLVLPSPHWESMIDVVELVPAT